MFASTLLIVSLLSQSPTALALGATRPAGSEDYPTELTVARRLTSSGGQPLAFARVRVRSSGERATTDDKGAFTLRLQGLETQILWIDTADGRRSWALLDPLAINIDPTSRAPKLTVSFAAKARTPAAPKRQMGKAVAAELFAELLQQANDAKDLWELRCWLEHYAAVDLDGALAKLEDGPLAGATREDIPDETSCGPLTYYDPALQDGVEYHDYVRARLYEAAAPLDAAARSRRLAMQLEPTVEAYELRRALRGQPHAEQANVLLSALDNVRAWPSSGRRARALSTLAVIAYDHGHRPIAYQAFKLVETQQRGDRAAPLQHGDNRGYDEALMRLYPHRALIRVRTCTASHHRSSGLLGVAERFAASDPALCEALLAEAAQVSPDVDASILMGRRLGPIAYALASNDPTRAVRVAAAYDKSGYCHGMVARGWLDAEGTVEERAARRLDAVKLLREASELHEALGRRERRHFHSSGQVGALLLSTALRADPEGGHAWILRALCHTATSRGEDDALLGWALIDYDPPLAEALAFGQLARCRGNELDLGSVDLHAWSLAATLQPSRTASLARRRKGMSMTHAAFQLARDPAERRPTFLR